MTHTPTQLCLPLLPLNDLSLPDEPKKRTNGQLNRLDDEDRAVHDWYRFVLSYPPHLVRDYIVRFGLNETHTILDPFCGTGTTLVEAKLARIGAVGLEANPFAHFASSVKVDWGVNPDDLYQCSRAIAQKTLSELTLQGIDDSNPFPFSLEGKLLKTLNPDAASLLITNSISPIPLHKILTLLEIIDQDPDASHHRHMRLALANALVFKISNLHFGPEVGVGKIKPDAPVVALWLSEIDKMIHDLRSVSEKPSGNAIVHLADSRNIGEILKPQSIDAIITSPPYPNEKDYTRTTRLESVILGFIKNKTELRQFKKTLIRSNTRGVYKEDQDDQWVTEIPEIQRIAAQIEERRIELGKTSGFEKLYSKVTKLYFGGMSRHLSDLKPALKPGARLAYVVGDQASYLRIMIRTGELIAEIAKRLGYEVEGIDLFRTRFASASQEQLREEVVVLRWPG
jgi:DNA modification methylase